MIDTTIPQPQRASPSETLIRNVAKDEAIDVVELVVAKEKLRFYGVLAANAILLFFLGMVYAAHLGALQRIERLETNQAKTQKLVNTFAWAAEIVVEEYKDRIKGRIQPLPVRRKPNGP